MLKSLVITHVALIEKLEVEFTAGLNVLSGETGAGKSIIIDSLNFVLGAKIDKNMIKTGKDFAEVKALFETKLPEVKELLSSFDAEMQDGEVLLFRRLTADGKNTFKINGTTVTQAMQKAVAALLIDIHGQHEHQKLLKEKNQLDILDGFIGPLAETLRSQIEEAYAACQDIKRKMIKIGGSSEDRARAADFLRYQITEIEKVNFAEGEDETLSERKNRLLNQEKIIQNLSGAIAILSGGGSDSMPSVLSAVGEASGLLNNIAGYSKAFLNLAERLKSLKIEAQDIAEELENSGDLAFDEKEFNQIDTRLDEIKNIKKKYGATYTDVQKFLQKAKQDLFALENSQELLEKLIADLAHAHTKAISTAKELSVLRNEKAKEFACLVCAELAELGMQKSRFVVQFHTNEESLTKTGIDAVCFMLSANAGQSLKPLSVIISGGEMSRMSLAIKVIAAKTDNIFSMVFDEIDTGISGVIGGVLAQKLARVGCFKQVISVSHLAQIAAIADQNLYIYKTSTDNYTQTCVQTLDAAGKTKEVARLLSGLATSDIALQHAQELIEEGKTFKKSVV